MDTIVAPYRGLFKNGIAGRLRFFGRLKTELFYSRNWLSTAVEEFVAAVDSYIRWYKEARIKISLGFRSPIEHRKNLGLAA